MKKIKSKRIIKLKDKPKRFINHASVVKSLGADGIDVSIEKCSIMKSVPLSVLQKLTRKRLLIKEAESVFKTVFRAKTWLNTNNPYLKNKKPILCTNSQKDFDKVLSMLSSIKLGFPG